MKNGTYERWDFVAWREFGETAYALVNKEGWFETALNCVRDGDMGERDIDGIYSRQWATDYIYTEDYRPMTPREVRVYLSHVDASDADIVVLGKESYVLRKLGETL